MTLQKIVFAKTMIPLLRVLDQGSDCNWNKDGDRTLNWSEDQRDRRSTEETGGGDQLPPLIAD